jgi:hypothetical protein
LGLLGGRQTQVFLSAFLAQEKDAALRSAVLATMGAIRSDPDEIMRQGISRFVMSNPELKDSRLTTSLVNALDEISLYQGSLGQSGRIALMQLVTQAPSSLRPRIQKLLKDRP